MNVIGRALQTVGPRGCTGTYFDGERMDVLAQGVLKHV